MKKMIKSAVRYGGLSMMLFSSVVQECQKDKAIHSNIMVANG